MKIRDLFDRRRHARHPAGRLLPRAEPREAPARGRRVHHHRRLPRRRSAHAAACRVGHPRAVRPPAHAASPGARQAGGPELPASWISGLLRLRQVELRQAARPRARRRDAPRRHARSRRRCSRRDDSPRARKSCATPGTTLAETRPDRGRLRHRRRRARQRAHPRRRRPRRSRRASATARRATSSPTTSSSSSATASGSASSRPREKTLGKAWSVAKDERAGRRRLLARAARR